MQRLVALVAFGLASWTLAACGDDDDDNGALTNTGQACMDVGQCFPDVEEGALQGEAVCLDRVEGGYCTHHCTQDTDCCAAPGECVGDQAQVCGPFESTGEMYCFLSCENADWEDDGFADGDAYCARFAGKAFVCRSTGGGSENRKVCVPNG